MCRCLTETGHSCRTSTRPRSPCTALRGWPSPRTVRSLWPTRATTASSSTSTCSSLVLVHDCYRLRQSLHQVLQVPLLQLMTVIDSGNHCFSSTGTCSSLVLVHDSGNHCFSSTSTCIRCIRLPPEFCSSLRCPLGKIVKIVC